MVSTAALAADRSNEAAVLWPEPLTMMVSALFCTQPGRLTISWITGPRSGVAIFSSNTVQAGILFQSILALVLGRLEIFPAVIVKVAGLSAACPKNDSEVTSDWSSLTVKVIEALRMVASLGTWTLVKRMPTT